MRIAVLAAAIGLSVAGLALAADAGGAIKKPTYIAAQDLGPALQSLARERNLYLIFAAKDVASLRTQGASGEMTANEAFDTLLSGTGLTYRFLDNNTVTILPVSSAAGSSGMQQPVSAVAEVDAQMPLRLAQADQPSASQGEGQGEDSKKEESSDSFRRGIPEILVTGSRSSSLNADIQRTPDDIQPYVVLDRKVIERSPAGNINDLLRSQLTMNYVQQSGEQTRPTLGGGTTSQVALRGLSSSQTLILIDGRRAGSRGLAGVEGQADLNAIPLSAIERIEVLPAAASGIYGGSATGGVINIVLRRDYSGLETTLKYQDSFSGGGAQRRIDMNGGLSFNGGKTSLMLSGSYSETDELLVGDRPFLADFVRRRDANLRSNLPDAYLAAGATNVLGATTNISSQPTVTFVAPGTPGATCVGTRCFIRTAPNLTLKTAYGGTSLGSPITHVPDGYAGVSSDAGAGLVLNAGTFNLDRPNTTQAGGLNSSVLNDPFVRYFSVTLRHSFTSDVEAYLSTQYSQTDGNFRRNSISSSFVIPTSSASNPFQQNIVVNVPLRMSEGEESPVEHEGSRALVGLKVGLPRNWSATLEYSFDRNDLTQVFAPTALTSVGTSAITSGALNVLADPPDGAFDVSQYMLGGVAVPPSHSVLNSGSLRFGGAVFDLPAGPLVLTTLFEYNDQRYGEFTQVFNNLAVPQLATVSEQSSTARSAYAEAQIPLISESMQIPAARTVDFQVAGRFDSYHSIGGITVDSTYDPANRPRGRFESFDPTLGLRYRPLGSVTFRASVGTGFLPPALGDLLERAPTLVSNTSGLRDPKRGNELLGSYFRRLGGSPDLDPEQSKSRSFGVILTPPVENLRLSFDWTRIEKRDNISSVSVGQDSIDQEDLLSGVIVRNTDPSTFGPFGVGSIVEINGSKRNSTRALSESYDVAVSLLFETEGIGAFEFDTKATRLIRNELQVFPTQPATDWAGVSTSPSWQGNAALTWTWHALSATWMATYLDGAWVQSSHEFSAAQGSDQLPGAAYHDAVFRYRFDGFSRSRFPHVFSGGSVQIGIKNIFNKEPRFLGTFSELAYDPLTSPLLRTYYISLNGRF